MDPDFELEEESSDEIGAMSTVQSLTISMSYDAENVEGHQALEVIKYITTVIEDPLLLQL
jgi:pyruvate/2-oxoglutarate dehydrogenase complex dihydrolipoamide acyltransferase (E2) component